MYVGGQEWAVPLSPLGLLLSSLPHVFSCSSCRAPHSLSQGHAGGSLRDHCCRTGQLGRPQPARRHPRTETGDPAGTPSLPKTIREFSFSSLVSTYEHMCIKQQRLRFPLLYREFKREF